MGAQALHSFEPVRDCLRAVVNTVMNTKTVTSNAQYLLFTVSTSFGHRTWPSSNFRPVEHVGVSRNSNNKFNSIRF